MSAPLSLCSIEMDVLGGAQIDATAQAAQRIADLLGISVTFSFNDVKCCAAPGGSADTLSERQQQEQARKLQHPSDRRFARS